MAAEGSEAADAAFEAGIPILFLRPGQAPANLAAAMDVLTPDVIHLHGAIASEETVPLRVFSNRPLALHLLSGDMDESGRPLRRVRGVRLDWRGGQRVAAICAEGAAPLERSALPIGVTDICTARADEISAQWCMTVYRRLLSTPQPQFSDIAAQGMA